MAWSGKDKHRDRETGPRHLQESPRRGDRVFRIDDEQRRRVAASLRHIDEARVALEAQQDPRNRQIIRELRASADRIFDLINGLEDIGEG